MLIQSAIDDIVTRLEKELPEELYYHSIAHTLDVLDRVQSLGKSEGVSDTEIMLLRLAACFHDSGFLISSQNHEKWGCKIVREVLPDYGFDEDQIQQICGMIMSTKIPQSPKNLLEEIICDADLDYLGRTDFYTIGKRLFQELKAYNVLETEKQWDEIQVSFLSNHQYWTATNRAERAPQKAIYLEELQSKLASKTN